MKKTTINLNDNYHSKIHDSFGEPSCNLRGEVEVQCKNLKTGIIESTEKHNLILYGGREWLLKKVFGKKISGNYDYNKSLKWFGIGNGGGEPGNPLQPGTTLGSDNDLYNPVKINLSQNPESSANYLKYSSRVMSSGTSEYGYYKQATSVTIKEDHANPYVKFGNMKYPNIIAEIRIELTAEDCNGDSEVFQDLNEAVLFAAEEDKEDPGKVDNIETTVQNLVSVYRIPISANNTYDPVKTVSGSNTVLTWESDNATSLVMGYYELQRFVNNSWVTITSFDSLLVNTDPYVITQASSVLPADGVYRLKSKETVKLTWNAPFDGTNYTSIQYRTNSTLNDGWEELESLEIAEGPVDYIYFVNCKTPDIQLDAYKTEFRVVSRKNKNQEINILKVQKQPDNLTVNIYIGSESDQYVSEGDTMYITGTGGYSSSEYLISSLTPVNVSYVYRGNGTVGDPSYITVSASNYPSDEFEPDELVGTLVGNFSKTDYTPYTAFSKINFSSIRKTIDREVVLLWKIYF